MSRPRGFSLIELVVALALVLIVTAGVFALADPMHGTFLVQSESADMQQRLRVGTDALYKDLLMSGAGAYQGALAGPLGNYFAPVLPYRRGTSTDDPPGTFKTDTVTLMYVPETMAQTTIATAGPSGVTGDVAVNVGPGCPVGDAFCGFKNRTSALLYDAHGTYDTFVVTSVQPSALMLNNTSTRVTSTGYQANVTKIVEFALALYYLKNDTATGTYQLMYHGSNADVPVLDHVVALTFEYYGEAEPPRLTGKPLNDPAGPWTTYGPPPPSAGQQIPTGGYPPGENCTFALDPTTGVPVPRLVVLGGGGSGLVPLTAAQLDGSDGGPWCPDAANANRWDADLLRIRTIAVTIRVESANAALRGPASTLFAHGGSARGGKAWLPDYEMRFQVAPRNLGR